MKLPFFLVDAFTDRPFAGNPAGVCPHDDELPAAFCQSVGREMNQAETAFVRPVEDGFSLRWFTPEVEVDLCGHATLATAHVLWETGRLAPAETARFHTRSGLLLARRDGDAIVLDFPSTAPVPAEPSPELRAALGVPIAWCGRTRFDDFAVLESEAAVRSLVPDLAALAHLPATRGVVVTAMSAGGGPYDFVSRFFAPACGVPEDPVTGSAHCALGPYWGERLGKTALTGYQASRRGGVVEVSLHGDRVRLGGRAVTVVRGELLARP